MAEIVAYIKNNKTLIDNVTTSKVNVTDIINNLTTNVSNKPLSAAQGVALKALIDALENDKLDASTLSTAISTALAQAKASGEFDGKDGVSATHKWNGTVLTVTSASGTSSADLKGNKGDSGVYMGSVEPTDPNVVVWVNPDGEAEISEAAKNLKRHTVSPQRPQTVIVNNVQDSTTYKGSGIVADTENKILWNKSIHVSGAGSYIRFHKNHSPFSIDMKNNLLVIGIKINSIAANATLDVRVADASGVLIPYNLMVPGATTVYGEWQEFTIPMGGYHRENSNNNPANVDFSNIVDIYIISVNGACDFNVQYIGYRPNPLHKGIVSFTFDDGYKSAADGIKVLAERGATGTLYVMGEVNENTFLTTSELQNLVRLYGTDVEAHGGTEYQNLTDNELIEHWISIKKYLIENGLSNGDHLAYPGGKHPTRVWNLAKRYFQSCRTIKSNIPVESYPPYDSHAIRAVTGVSQNAVKPSKVKQLIDQAIISKSWLILVLHKIDDGTDTTSMSCSMEAFKEIVDYAVASDIRIMNVAEVFETNGQSVSVAELTQSVIDALPIYNGEVS